VATTRKKKSTLEEMPFRVSPEDRAKIDAWVVELNKARITKLTRSQVIRFYVMRGVAEKIPVAE